MYILIAVVAVVAVLLFLRPSNSNSPETPSKTNPGQLPLVTFDGIQIDREWWPRYRVIGKQVFPYVRIKDIDKVGEWPYLEQWWHRESMGRYYDVIVDGAEFFDPDDYHEDKFEMKRGWTELYEDYRLFLEWAAIREGDRENVYEVTANVCERIGRFPWENDKGTPHYLHKRSWNIMIEKTQDPTELAEMVEVKMSSNQNG